MGTHRRPRARRGRWQVAAACGAGVVLLAVLAVFAGLPAGLGVRRAAGARPSPVVPSPSPSASRAVAAHAAVSPRPSPGDPAATEFSGTPTVGALFDTDAQGRLGNHFCTASVVDSPGHDTVLTAAHCVGGASRSGGLGIAFVPGYHDGRTPYGVWTATRFTADSDWAADSDPDHDVGFLTVTDSDGSGRKVQDVTGAAGLGIGRPLTGMVRVVGYPSSSEKPITCENETSRYSDRQMEFDCRGYENGTSGGPFFDRGGSVIGVIGGYQRGGLDPDVSYSTTFGSDVRSLYATAVS